LCAEKRESPLDGIIPLLKPKKYTSHDCVAVMRGITGIKKIGHTGTLDPNVEGVLPICLGEATKTIPYLQELTKVYVADVTLGISTTTEDADGEVVEQVDVKSLPTIEEIERVLASFEGEITQIPPLYSAIRVKGKRLYEYARENIEVERPKRKVTIFSIKRIKKEMTKANPSFRIIINCSKGTYIRTLAVDIGKKLGFPAHMSHLERIETDSFTIDEAVTFEEVEQAIAENRIEDILFSVERALQHMPKWFVSEAVKQRVLLGQKLPRPEEAIEAPFLVMYENELLAIYKYHEVNEDEIKPVRVFNMYKNEGETE